MPLKNFLVNADISNYQLLFRLISPLTDNDDANIRLDRPDVSWERLLGMANTYLMTPALWSGLVKKSLNTELEEELCDYMQELYSLNEDRNKGLRRQAVAAITALNKAGIVPLLIKGAVQLFNPLHENFGTRIMTDLDMVVPDSRMNDAIEALMELGYQKQDRPEVDWKAHHHDVPLGRLGDYGTIELHRRTLGRAAEPVLPTEELWAAADLCQIEDLRFKTPCLMHAVLVGFLHSQISQSDYRKIRIDYKSLFDMVIMIHDQGKAIEWDEIHKRLSNHRLNTVFRTYLWTAHRLFHLPMPNGIKPHASSKAYHALCLATIRWQWVDTCIEFYFNIIERLRSHFGPLKQLFIFRWVSPKT